MIGKIETKKLKPNSNVARNGKSQKLVQDIWDEQIESDESLDYFRKSREQALKDLNEGRCSPGGFGEE